MGGKVGRRTLAATEHFCSDDKNKKTVVLYFGKVSRYTNGGCSCLRECLCFSPGDHYKKMSEVFVAILNIFTI